MQEDKEREAVGDWLQVRWPGPGQASRRMSSLTNSSFYLDRRGSLMDMPFSVTPFLPHDDYLLEEPAHYNLINIQVTYPTPEVSPCISKDSVYDISGRQQRLSIPKAAPLASVGSIGLPSTEQDNHSVGSDSVFLDEELIDTEDEVEGFSTDSDGDNISTPFVPGDPQNQLKSQSLDSQRNNRVSQRRFSIPSPLEVQDNQSRTLSPSALLKESLKVLSKNHKVSSDSETIHVNVEGGLKKSSRNASSPTNMSASCGQLVRALQAFNSGNESPQTAPGQDCWSRETLF